MTRSPSNKKSTSLVYPEIIVDRKPPVNLKPEDEVYFRNEFQRKLEAVFFFRFSNIFILYNSLFNLKRFRFYHFLSHWITPFFKAKLFRLSLLLKKGKKIDKAMWVTNNWSEGYFHWLLEAVPRILVLEEYKNSHPILLPAIYKNYPHVAESLTYLKSPYIYFEERRPVLVSDLVSCSHTALLGNYNKVFTDKTRELFTRQFSHNTPHRRIYISRKYALMRKIVNETQFESLMEEYDFEMHFFENYTLTKQIELMTETKYLLALHGGALTNMLFMKEGCKVMELRNYGDTLNNCYFSLASVLNLDYFYQLNHGTLSNTQFADIEINIEELRRNLKLMIRD